MTVTLETLALQIEVNHQQLTAGLNRAEHRVSGFTSKAAKSFSLLKIAALGIFGSLFLRSIIDAASSMEQLKFRLETTTGSAVDAAEAMQFLSEAANRQAVDIVALSDGYVRLLPAVKTGALTMDEMREMLGLVNDNMKAFGISTADSKRVFFGLSQLLGSGIVTMENLKQVTEHMPGTLTDMAKATDRSLGSLIDWVSTGKMLASEAKGPLLEALKANKGAAEDMAGSYQSLETKVRNAFKAMSEGRGALEITKTGAKGLISVMEFIGTVMDNAYEQGIRNANADARNFTHRRLQYTIEEDLALRAQEQAEFELQTKKDLADAVDAQTAAIAKKAEQSRIAAAETAAMNAAEELSATQKKLTPKLDDFKRSLMDERALEDDDFRLREDQLKEFLNAGLLGKQEHHALLEEEQLRHEAALRDITLDEAKVVNDIMDDARSQTEEKIAAFNKRLLDMDKLTADQKIKVGADMFMDILGDAAKHNKTLFEINKAAGIANAVISTAQGVAKALELPFPLNLAAAAAVGAVGATQIASIASQQFNSGGGGGSGGAGVSVPSTAAAQEASGGGGGESGNSLNVAIQGVDKNQMFSGTQVRELISAINDEISNGAIIKGVSVT